MAERSDEGPGRSPRAKAAQKPERFRAVPYLAAEAEEGLIGNK